MNLAHSEPLHTVEEYLALERASEERHEYLDGQIYAMAGESPDHGTICTNINGQLYNQLRGTPCQVWSKDIKVRNGPAPKKGYSTRGLFSYPDLLVVCGEAQFHDDYKDVLLNPIVLIEVLSPTTESFDRGEKWLRYQTWLPALTDYLLVSQSRPVIERFLRQIAGGWLYSSVTSLEANIHLSSIDCTLRLAEVYDRISFPIESAEDQDDE
jgi:Uma2 family endonuclease